MAGWSEPSMAQLNMRLWPAARRTESLLEQFHLCGLAVIYSSTDRKPWKYSGQLNSPACPQATQHCCLFPCSNPPGGFMVLVSHSNTTNTMKFILQKLVKRHKKTLMMTIWNCVLSDHLLFPFIFVFVVMWSQTVAELHTVKSLLKQK